MKYYVISKDLKVVIAGPHIHSPEDAACEALLRNFKDGMEVSPIMIVSEQGFDVYNDEHSFKKDVMLNTKTMLERSGFSFGEEYES